MYEVTFDERHKLGLERLTGSNRGLVYANERRVTVDVPADEEGGEATQVEKWAYDVYDVDDARTSASAKNSVIGASHPLGDEQKILRKTLARVLKALGEYDSEDNAEFRAYNEFAEALDVKAITGSAEAADPTDEELLLKAKAAKIAAIAEYDASANVNAFSFGGVPMWLNFDLRSRLSRSLDVCQTETMTKYFGGREYTFPVATWRAMVNAVESYADQCQTVTEAHKAAVLAMETVAEVDAFDITVGYPEKMAF